MSKKHKFSNDSTGFSKKDEESNDELRHDKQQSEDGNSNNVQLSHQEPSFQESSNPNVPMSKVVCLSYYNNPEYGHDVLRLDGNNDYQIIIGGHNQEDAS